MITESDGENSRLFPKEARLRSVTYSAPLYVDVRKTELSRNEDGQPEAKVQMYPKVFIGKVRQREDCWQSLLGCFEMAWAVF